GRALGTGWQPSARAEASGPPRRRSRRRLDLIQPNSAIDSPGGMMIDLITWSEFCDLMKRFYYPKKRFEAEIVVPLRLECGEGDMEIFNNANEKVFSLTREEYEECIICLDLIQPNSAIDSPGGMMIDLITWSEFCDLMKRFYYPKKRFEAEIVVPLRLECGEGDMEIFNNANEKVFSLTREEYEECISS